jgi:hypothetical protein
VLVELFTSEGCSSCPPADLLLGSLEKEQPEVIALSEHVDYWNRLGWADPFSSADFTRRQQRYAQLFRLDGVYTPQMVVDGRVEFVGSDAGRARASIAAAAKAPKAKVSLEVSQTTPAAFRLRIRVERLPQPAEAELLLIITESNLQTNVPRGENRGRLLRHTAVVRRLTVLGKVSNEGLLTEADAPLDPSWNRANLRAVVLVQARGQGPVLGAASAILSHAPDPAAFPGLGSLRPRPQ